MSKVLKVVLFPITLVAKVATKLWNGKKPKASSGANRTSKTLEPEDFRKIMFGETACAIDLRYWEVYGSGGNSYDEVIAAACHTIESFGAFYIEEELVSFSGNNATGNFAGVLSRTTNNGAPGNAALSAGAGGIWTSASKFTGVAHYALKWTYDSKKLPNGIPSKYTQVGKGAKVYDPRRDSTNGGSGSHRFTDQTTWEYSPVDSNGVPIGRNNALQMLWYVLGWRVADPASGTTFLVAGRGIDPTDINWPDMIAAANDAEALQNYTDCVLSTGDTHANNEGVLSADGLLGTLIDPGGLWSYKVTKDDVGSSAVSLGEDDLVEGDVTWIPQQPLSSRYNEVVGTFIDPAVTSLYQNRAYPMVKDAAYYTADGFKKRKTQNFSAVQTAAMAQRLSRIKLNQGRYTGEFTATFNMRALKAKAWDIIDLTLVDRFGFTAKKFRVISQAISLTGVQMQLREEHSSIYAGGTVVTQPAPSAGVKYDPRQQIATGTITATPVVVGPTGGVQFDGCNLGWPTPPANVQAVDIRYRKNGDTYWTTARVQREQTSIVLQPLVSSVVYDLQVSFLSIHGISGPWTSPAGTFTAGTGMAMVWSGVVGTGRPDDFATMADNIQLNAMMTTDATGYNFTGGSFSRAVGVTGAPTPWVLESTSATMGGGGELIFPLSKVAGGKKVFISFLVYRSAGLTSLDMAANTYNALTGGGIGPIVSGSIVPTSSGSFQLFTFSGIVHSNAGYIGITIYNMAGNAGTVQIAAPVISYSELGADVTGLHTSADTAYVNGIAAATLTADAATAKANAASALSQISTIAADGVFDRSEKPAVKQDYDAILAEQSTYTTRATALGVSSTTYTTAISALTSYLTGLSATWYDPTTDIAITRTTFNGKFTDVYFARQALADALVAAAAATQAYAPSLSMPATQLFNAAYTGVLISGQVPKVIKAIRKLGDTDVSSSTTWSLTVGPGCTATIASTGFITITDVATTDKIGVTSIRDGVTLNGEFAVKLDVAQPPITLPAGGGSGTAAMPSAVSSASYGGADSTEITVTAGSAGSVDLTTGPINFLTTNAAPTGSYGLTGIWQSKPVGGSYTDVATEIGASFNDVVTYNSVDAAYENSGGLLSVHMTKTGLTAGNQYVFKFRLKNPSGTRLRSTSSGLCSAVAS